MPQKKIAQAVTGALLLYLAYLLAQMTWLFLAKPMPVQPALMHSGQQQNNKKSQIDVAALSALNLFGQYQKAAKVEVVDEPIQDAPETKLNLTLTGVVASSEKNGGAAIIANSGRQETYGIGDTITGTAAVLEKVLSDRVLIRQSGRLETLMLDGFKYQKGSAPATNQPRPQRPAREMPKLRPSTSAQQQIDQRHNKQLTQQATALRDDIAKDPGKISDYLRISPFRRDGQIVGYRLAPGKNSEFFKASGLRHGDIAVQLNGLDLTEPKQAAQALQALREETEITLTVDRQGDITDILFSIAN